MSALLNSKIAKAGFAVALVASSFGATAKQITLKEFVDYTMAVKMLHIKLDVETQIEQEIYDAAFASMKHDSMMPDQRPVVSISEVADEEDEE